MVDYYDEGWMDAEEAGYEGPGWYFWDETQTTCFGPYPDSDTAYSERDRYIREVLGERTQSDNRR